MKRKTKLFPYVLTVAALISAFVVAVTIFFPAPTQSAPTVENGQQRSVSPRIAAWQERIAEEKLYAEKEARRVELEKAAELAARQQYREATNARALTLKTAEDRRATAEDDRAKELARARAQTRQKAQQVAAQRQRQQRQFEGDALGYAPVYQQAPAYHRGPFQNIYSAMREMQTN